MQPTMFELLIGLTEYFVFYNTERPHQSMSYGTLFEKTPMDQLFKFSEYNNKIVSNSNHVNLFN